MGQDSGTESGDCEPVPGTMFSRRFAARLVRARVAAVRPLVARERRAVMAPLLRLHVMQAAERLFP